MKATLLALLLSGPASAQNLRGTLSAPALPTIRLSPGIGVSAAAVPLSSPLLLPSFVAPVLPTAVAVLPAATPVAAKVTVANAVAAAAPALQAISQPNVSGSAAHGIGLSLEDALTNRRSAGAVFAAPSSPVNGALPTARSAPAVSDVSYARGVTKAQKAALAESLTRRKAGWFRGLSRMGVALEGPIAPALKVTKAESLKTGSAFTVEWKQGATKLGTFRVVVPTKDPEPEFRRLADPAPADNKVVYLRFLDVPEADILAFAAAKNLRVVARGWRDQPWTVAVTGRDRAAVVAKRLNGVGPVLSASAKVPEPAEADQLLVAFKPGAAASDLAAAFRRHELSVLEKRQDGVWRLAAAKGRAAKALHSLEHDGTVLYARPVLLELPETLRSVVTLKEGADLPALLARRGLKVVERLGEREWLLGGSEGGLAADEAVQSVVAVGSLPDSAVEAAANGTASYKGRPWSSTEYNLNWAMGYDSLRRRGATEAQLKRYEELTAAAPIRGGSFNPWSGD